MTTTTTPVILSNYFGNQILQKYLTEGVVYLACHTSDPTPVGLLQSEVASSGYLRQRILFSPASGKAAVSKNAQTFPGMPACVVTHLGLWTAVAAGNLLLPIQLPAPITVALNGQLLVTAGDVAVQL